jgi:2-iminobutanoate/2-iminopropanoate deaminase
MSIQKIETKEAPAAIGPYSQGVKVGGFVFFSGQIPLDPQTGEIVAGGISEQAERVMANMKAALRAAGLGYEKVVKTTIFLTDLGDFATVNEIYGKCFSGVFPARSTVQVSALPRGSLIEIEWIASAE